MKRISLLLAAVFLLFACRKESPSTAVPGRFSLFLEEAGTPQTRSLLQSADIETKVTSVTLGLYQGGLLVEKAYYGSGFDQMAFPLEDGVYTIYALVNMGDMQDALPAQEAGLASLTYTIPGYMDTGTGIEYRGIPMAGFLTYTVGVSTNSAIPVKRLLAKVTANLSCGWTGTITSVKVFNLNAKLKPFGESAAASSADILGVQEFQAGTGTDSGTFVFYVPENLQGTINGIVDSADKSPDANPAIDAMSDRLTYLETLVTGAGAIDGTITYRSYLGSNATSNFDIQRNCRYTWTLQFLPDGRLLNDWKHENRLNWSEYRYSINPATLYLYEGEVGTIQITRNEDRYTNGTFQANGGPSVNYSNQFSWSYASLDNPSIVNDNAAIQGKATKTYYAVTAVGSGRRRVTATGPDGSDEVSLYCDVTAMNYKRLLVLLASPGPRAVVGETVTLHALMYTVQNGVVSEGTDVTGDYLNCHIYRNGSSGSSPIKVLSQGQVTATGPGQERFSASYSNTPDHKMIYANGGLFVTFEASRTGNLTISGGSTVGAVGSPVQLRAYFTPYSGGAASATVEVTSSATWNILEGGKQYSVSSSGRVSSTGAGVCVAQATYTVNGIQYQAQTAVRFNRH